MLARVVETHSFLRDALGEIMLNLLFFGCYKTRVGGVFPRLIRYFFIRVEL